MAAVNKDPEAVDGWAQKRHHGMDTTALVCKTLVAQLLQGPGMHWSKKDLSHIMALRTTILSLRDKNFWRSIHTLPLNA